MVLFVNIPLGGIEMSIMIMYNEANIGEPRKGIYSHELLLICGYINTCEL